MSSQPQTSSSTPSQANGTSTKKRMPKWLKIVGVIIIIFIVAIVVAVIVATAATKAPQKVSDQFVNDLQSGNSSAAYALTNQAFQGATTEGQLDSIVQRISPGLQGQEKVTGRAIDKSTGSPETAVLVYTIKTSNGNAYVKTELRKSGNVWQILNFKSDSKPLDTKVE
ncbi:MAG TPA: hypothetical protein VLE99_03000 [Candidatus Saccharimonadales bacterium]|nr:hypothetical protein [Candidatus Saccharimonadales bacterium]